MIKRKLPVFLSHDRTIYFIPLFLCLFGLIMIYDSSAVAAINAFNNKFYFVERQCLWFMVGLVFLYFFSKFDYNNLKKIALPFLLINIILLILVLFPGMGKMIYGGRRWLQLGIIGFQPAELTKLSLIIYFSTLFEKRREFMPFIFLNAFLLLLLLMEPDMGTAFILFGSVLTIYFISGAPRKNMALIFGFGSILIPILIFLFPYRKQRFLAYINSLFNIQGASYHLRQILISFGSGGFFGRGFGQSRQKFLFLPEVTTDSIFAVIGEEFGFIGTAILVLVFVFFIYLGYKLAMRVEDEFGKMLAVGLVSMIALQTAVNMGAMVSLLPLTGVPLPFISYGGSSLVINLSAVGILYNISRSSYTASSRLASGIR